MKQQKSAGSAVLFYIGKQCATDAVVVNMSRKLSYEKVLIFHIRKFPDVYLHVEYSYRNISQEQSMLL
jgi:hypothetical protein